MQNVILTPLQKVILTWRVVNNHTGQEILTDAIGPRDALFAVAGVVPYMAVGEWLVSRDWKVNFTAHSFRSALQ